jgi:hypothetical protein
MQLMMTWGLKRHDRHYRNILLSNTIEPAPVTYLQNQLYKLEKQVEMLERTKAKQLAMIERIMENAREIPNLDISVLLKARD